MGLYYICITLLVIKAIISEVIKILKTFVKSQPKWSIKKKTIEFWDTPTTNYYGLQIGIFTKGTI